MAKRAGAYKSEKRKKEIKRQKKKEEKMLRRLKKNSPAAEGEIEGEEFAAESESPPAEQDEGQ